MTYATRSDTSGRKVAGRSAWVANASVRLLGFGYSVAAVALRLKNTPALQLMTIIFAAILLAITFLTSDHVNRASLVSGALFLLVNVFQLLLLLWELRPVVLHGEKRMLHDLIFPNLTISAFNRLIRFAEWRDGEPEDLLATQGSRVTEIIVLLKGSAEVERDGQHVTTLGAGAIIGEVGSLSAKPFSSTIRLAGHSRFLAWKKDPLDHFFACHPSIASGFERAFISRLEVTPAFRPYPERDELQG
jgi:CRP-like cAMP-binding protein